MIKLFRVLRAARFLIALAIIAVGIYAWTSRAKLSNSDISGWQTYQDSELGFEFKYPSNVNVKQPLNQDLLTLESTEQVDQVTDLQIATNLFFESVNTCQGSYSDQKTFGNVTFAHHGENGVEEYCFSNNLRAVRIVDISKDQKMVREILSTFKFTEPTTAVDTSQWRTYRNNEYGFEFKYPSIFTLEYEVPEDPSLITLNHRVAGFEVYKNKDGGGLEDAIDLALDFQPERPCTEVERNGVAGQNAEEFVSVFIKGVRYNRNWEPIYYCLKDDLGNTIFEVRRTTLRNWYSYLGFDQYTEDKISKEKDYLQFNKREQLTEAILSTFKFTH